MLMASEWIKSYTGAKEKGERLIMRMRWIRMSVVDSQRSKLL